MKKLLLILCIGLFTFTVSKVQAQIVSTIAGRGTGGSTDGSGTDASFSNPSSVAVDRNGNIYVADNGNHKIRKITSAGVVSTFAGNGTSGSADGVGAAASFNSPYGVAVDANDNVYVADFGNHKIRKITPSGMVSTFAGGSTYGSADGNSSTARFYYPFGLTVDGSGNVYVADRSNNKIRKITPLGIVSTLAGSGNAGSIDGNGVSASFNLPMDVAVDGSGNVYVADRNNNKIRKVTAAGAVSTFAGDNASGNVDGNGNSARFNYPYGVAVDGNGNVYVADYRNHKIRKITTSGVVSTFAGTGSSGSIDGNATTARFNSPTGVAVDVNGNVYVADISNHKIRKIALGVLPVNLLSFKLELKNGSTELRWTTASEKDNNEFILSRSADGKTFKELTRIKGAGNSNENKNYSYTDRNPLNGINYYQLAQLDNDGQLNVIGDQVVNFKLSSASVTVFPNPTAREINVSIPSEFGKKADVSILDITGKTLHAEKLTLLQGVANYKLNNTQLPAGTYIVKVKGEQKTESLKVLVK